MQKHQGMAERASSGRNGVIGHNTCQAVAADGTRIITLHETPILTFCPDGRIILDFGGYDTVTTRDRMNRLGEGRALVMRSKGRTYVNGTDVTRWRGAVLIQPDDSVARRARRVPGVARNCEVVSAMTKQEALAILERNADPYLADPAELMQVAGGRGPCRNSSAMNAAVNLTLFRRYVTERRAAENEIAAEDAVDKAFHAREAFLAFHRRATEREG